MKTIRRIYLYLVTAISLQVVLWGVINLLRSMLDTQRVGGSALQLAGALATIIVGLPVFLLHWWLAQRRIPRDTEERGSAVRALFLYGLLFGLIIPILQNSLAIIDRFLVDVFNIEPQAALLGFGQTWIDNGIALVMNAVLAVYLMVVIRRDWLAGSVDDASASLPSLENLSLARRVFRYALVLYSLGLLVFGVQQILRFLLDQFGGPNINAAAPLANGIALTLLGAAVWWSSWQVVQQSLHYEDEHSSQFRLVFLYLLSLIGLGTLLASTGQVLFEIMRLALSGNETFAGWMLRVSSPLATAVPFALLWFYHNAVLQADHAAVPAAPRRESLARGYLYLLAFTGLLTTFIGLQEVLSFIVDRITTAVSTDIFSRNALAGGLAALLIGLPLWLRPWLRVSSSVASAGEAGDRARRSTARKTYLYLAIFIGVVGLMISAGGLIFQLLSLVLGGQVSQFAQEFLQNVQVLVLFILLLAYHGQALRTDNRIEERALGEKFSLFPVLVLDPGDDHFAGPVVSAIREEAAEIPVAVHYTSSGAPGESLSSAGAVVLTAGMAANPPEALRIWLQAFDGSRIVVPLPRPGWIWIDAEALTISRLSRKVARTVLKLAEGETLEGGRVSAWVIVAAIFGGLIGLSVLLNLIALLFSM